MNHKNKKIIVQNNYDFYFFKNNFDIKKKDIIEIKGSGVDLSKFVNINIKNKNKSVSFIGRIIGKKE